MHRILGTVLLPLLALGLAVPTAAEPEPARPWTLLVYGAADNNADGPLLEFLDGLREALDDDPGVELVLLIDRHPGFSDDARSLGADFAGAQLYRLRRDSAERLAGDAELPEVREDGSGELDTADADVLKRFIAWGKRRFPAKRTGVLVYSHASGKDMCPDETSGRSMGIAEVSERLSAAQSIDFLALELCNMGGIEIAYQWRPAELGGEPRFGAEVLLAIPNAGPPLDWERAFARLRSPGHAVRGEGEPVDPAHMGAADFGRLIVEEGLRGRELAGARGTPNEHEAAACYDLRAAGRVKRAVDALAAALAASDAREPFLALRHPDPLTEVMNYTRGGPYVDLYDLCQRIARSEEFADPVRDAAEMALLEVDAMVLASFGMSAYAGFEPGKHGLFIVMPADERGIWREFAWYTPLDGPDAAGHGRWSFLADGCTPGNGAVETWFELLDRWHDTADEGGGLNRVGW